MSYKKLIENHHDENSNTNIPRASYKSNTLAKQELANFGVLVDKADCAFSGAALNLLLDNMASASDIMNVLETGVNRLDYMKQVAPCEFCMKKCNVLKACCPQKEQQIDLLNNALKKIKHIAHKNPFVNSQINPIVSTQERLENQDTVSENDIETMVKKETFRKLRKKLLNMKKYYPDVYYCPRNIIEEWGKECFDYIELEILEMDQKESSFFWV